MDMHIYGTPREALIAACGRNQRGQQPPGPQALRGLRQPDAAAVVDLLGDAAVAARPAARALLLRMQAQPWRLSGPGAGDAAQATLALQVGGRCWQLHCRQAPRLQVREISG
ncbi:hypothetical protein CSC70_00195 [Pseudoxanthomonas kalamensis DSM 18571]|uniref:hypothetical protein n=1 Tax=Pseudoxanthomonas kalamensis TaxID=289483 RepID=UPI001391505D|nr:hypothetical protein [Pseudoxanthomonas kalamensis]KAF1711997.1 hypothetical protein CSC70_00195 [Pseudoxanthomonas kalamensis DSM 18571]